MSKITITISTDNAAFEEAGIEVGRILRELADRWDDGALQEDVVLRDVNGNRVGACRLSD